MRVNKLKPVDVGKNTAAFAALAALDDYDDDDDGDAIPFIFR